jgi:hypothetical protein
MLSCSVTSVALASVMDALKSAMGQPAIVCVIEGAYLQQPACEVDAKPIRAYF